MERFDVVVIGAGAAGMMCAAEAGRRGRRVLVVDHARAAGEKIRISGGGRCNFTNLNTAPDRFISANPRFCVSALARYPAQRFVELIDRYGIAWHEKTVGQLFCDGSARQVVDMLLSEMSAAGVQLRLGRRVAGTIERTDHGFELSIEPEGRVSCAALVVATGGLSIPKMGASGLGYEVAARFGVPVTAVRPGLVPLTLAPDELGRWAALAGVSAPVRAACGRRAFEDALLFTHRGLSGPAILQLSSYVQNGEGLRIDLTPGADMFESLRQARRDAPRQSLATVLAQRLPRRLAQLLAESEGEGAAAMANLSDKRLRAVAAAVNAWDVQPAGSEGYRTAEVTVGGVDTRALDSRTMEVKATLGLYFIGEVVDVTGWLGGYNFQWAWASGWCAGQVV
jgi:predicted Rossmann fold flavoprotein